MEIGEVIRKYRKEKHLTQEEMANCLGVTVPAVSKWETGHTQPDADTLMRLCCIYHIDNILEIFGYKSQKKAVFNLTAQEKNLIEEYRNHPDMQKAVQRLLEIEKESKI